ncbi:MMPL family transporter, partial [Streptomyces sp. NPDC051738]|uniref:MMPL family transporter n=1 Tax=Streptomyces sp. NPDC051738 TaxID=3365672 RepID=UPI0037CE5EA2
MSGSRGIAHLVCGRRAKWVVLVLWLEVLFLTVPFAQKLADAQDNDAASWLPGSAESTQVLEISENFRPEQIPAIVVYARDGGLTAQDRAAITEDVDRLKQLTDHGVRGAETRGPVFDREVDPRAAQVQVQVPITMDEQGWERIAPAVDSIGDVVGEGGAGPAVHITGPGGTSADFAEAFEGIDSTLLLSAMAVVIVMLLLTYRSPTQPRDHPAGPAGRPADPVRAAPRPDRPAPLIGTVILSFTAALGSPSGLRGQTRPSPTPTHPQTPTTIPARPAFEDEAPSGPKRGL